HAGPCGRVGDVAGDRRPDLLAGVVAAAAVAVAFEEVQRRAAGVGQVAWIFAHQQRLRRRGRGGFGRRRWRGAGGGRVRRPLGRGGVVAAAGQQGQRERGK